MHGSGMAHAAGWPNVFSTLVPGSGSFQLAGFVGLGYGYSVYHNRFPNSNLNLNHDPITVILP